MQRLEKIDNGVKDEARCAIQNTQRLDTNNGEEKKRTDQQQRQTDKL